MIQLAAGEWTASVQAELGGALLALNWRGSPILRPSPNGVEDILQTACFPLVPFANRIADARFVFGSREVTLPTLDRFAPHALHGEGWLLPWAVESLDDQAVVLTCSGGGDAWPWPWTAVQTIALTDAGLRIDLSMTNRADEPAPAGLGLHPYFHRPVDARLTLQADQVWLTDAREIPHQLAPSGELIDWTDGQAFADAPSVDHAYAGWSGLATVAGEGRTAVLRAGDNAGWAQIYAPIGETFVCVEPMTHRPDAIHAPASENSGLAVLAPDETLAMSMSITALGDA